jgi:dinuclear metal center YbgI/SA1388 family protein
MRVSDITRAIEAFAPLGIQENWDNSGLLIGSPDDEVSGVMVGFDCTPGLIDRALAAGCDMVITHHPLIFGGLKAIRPEDPVGEAVIKAVRGGVAVYAAHTTADKVIAGVSGAMARKLGLDHIVILEEEPGGTGLGVVGDLGEPMDPQALLALLKEKFALKVLRVSKPVRGKISRVAMCGGSGSSLIGAARTAGAQLYISADISYHHFFTPEGFMIADIGHFESEVEIVDIFFSELQKNFPNFAVCIDPEIKRSNPIQYI